MIVVLTLIHLYLWKRLVHDTLRNVWARRAGGTLVIVLAVLVPVTLIGVRAGHLKWLAWPGYMWLALMFYLLVTLAVLEIPRLAANLWLRHRAKAEAQPLTETREGRETAPVVALSSTADVAATETPIRSTDQVSADGQGGVDDQAGVDGQAGTDNHDRAAGDGGGEPGRGVDRRLLLARGAAIFAGLTAAGITGYGVQTALGGPRIDRVQLPMAKLPRAMDGTRLAVVSDIHLGPLTGMRHAERIVEVINSVNADIVCVVGDLVDGSVAELGKFAAPLRGIQSRQGAYFVTGNHEYYSGYQEWVEEVARLGMRPLRNERLELDGLDLAGVNDLGGADHGDAPDFARALGDRDTARPVVLMAHQPLAAVQAAPYGVDLQVSGHTHGGQMAPFNLLVKLEQPVVSGLGAVDGMPVYVTNGAGFWGPPVRVGAPPQVSVIELRAP
ncbi:metallophosphoesterase [Actinoplanes sp. NPDC051494]|uniref:metallophosphoesterase n=1 Tax=Actinoplanes sp. NPDC051494 TaxID=3363907 RepID=UPI003792B757